MTTKNNTNRQIYYPKWQKILIELKKAKKEQLTSSQISKQLGYLTESTYGYIKRFEKMNLITRYNKGSKQIIQLTKEGEEIVNIINKLNHKIKGDEEENV